MKEKNMFKEAHAFHKIALPAFLFLCLILFITGCSNDHYHSVTNNNNSVHNILELTDICNSIEGDDSVTIDDFSRVTLTNGNCNLEINYNPTEGESDE